MSMVTLLLGAIVFEVLGTMMLPLSQGFSRLIPSIMILTCYGIAFFLLSIVSEKLPLAVIYATWSGLGIFAVALLSYAFYGQELSGMSMAGLILIILGITLVKGVY